MAEPDAQMPTPDAAERSLNLTIAVIVLAILPLVLPFLFYGPVGAEIGPRENEAWSHCGFDCPAVTDLERLGWLVILGPSFLVALISILFGALGIARRTTSAKDAGKYRVSLALGICWAVLILCVYGVIYWVAGVVP